MTTVTNNKLSGLIEVRLGLGPEQMSTQRFIDKYREEKKWLKFAKYRWNQIHAIWEKNYTPEDWDKVTNKFLSAIIRTQDKDSIQTLPKDIPEEKSKPTSEIQKIGDGFVECPLCKIPVKERGLNIHITKAHGTEFCVDFKPLKPKAGIMAICAICGKEVLAKGLGAHKNKAHGIIKIKGPIHAEVKYNDPKETIQKVRIEINLVLKVNDVMINSKMIEGFITPEIVAIIKSLIR